MADNAIRVLYKVSDWKPGEAMATIVVPDCGVIGRSRGHQAVRRGTAKSENDA